MVISPQMIIAIIVGTLGYGTGLVCTLTALALLIAALRHRFTRMRLHWLLASATIILGAVTIIGAAISPSQNILGAFTALGLIYGVLTAVIVGQMHVHYEWQEHSQRRVQEGQAAAQR